jgi:transcriptional regulator GlxA family with amidase domain
MARLSDALVARALRFQVDVTDQPGQPWTVASLAAVAGLSRAAFAKRFRQRLGTTPAGYLLSIRMARARTLLRDERSTLAAVAAQVGYGSEAAFSAAFKRQAGTAPGACRRGCLLAGGRP